MLDSNAQWPNAYLRTPGSRQAVAGKHHDESTRLDVDHCGEAARNHGLTRLMVSARCDVEPTADYFFGEPLAFCFAQRAFCAAEILARAAADIFRRVRGRFTALSTAPPSAVRLVRVDLRPLGMAGLIALPSCREAMAVRMPASCFSSVCSASCKPSASKTV